MKKRSIATVCLVALDVVALAVAAARVGRKSDVRPVIVRPVIERLTATEYSIRVFHPDTAVRRAMPCFQPRDADSTAYAALPIASQSPCHLASSESRRSPHDPGTRSLGRW